MGIKDPVKIRKFKFITVTYHQSASPKRQRKRQRYATPRPCPPKVVVGSFMCINNFE